MKLKMKLSRTLSTLLLMGCKQAGSYKPEEALSSVEENMTLAEAEAATDFLKWVVAGNRTFGHGNIGAVWAEWQAAQAK